MKEWNKSILTGSICIAISIVIAGVIVGRMIADNLGSASSYVPNTITLNSAEQNIVTSDYMSTYEAAQYCRIDYDSFEKLSNDGKLAGTYVEIPVEKWMVDEEAFNELKQQTQNGTPEPVPPTMIMPGIERVFIRAKLDEWMLAQVGS